MPAVVKASELDSLTALDVADDIILSRDGESLASVSVGVLLGKVGQTLESRFAANENDVDAALAQIGTLNTAVTSGLSAAATVSAALAARVTTVENDTDELTTTLSSFQASTASTLSALATADSVEASARLALAGRVTTAETDIDALQSATTTLSSTVTNNYTTLANAQTTEANARLALASRVTTAENDIDDLTSTQSSLASTVSNNFTTLSNAQTTEANARLALASVVDTKSRTYRQANAPTGTLKEGDEWYDSDDNLKPYYYVAGTGWVDNSDGRFAALTNSLSSLSSTVSNNFTTLSNADTTEANARVALASRVTTAEGNIGSLQTGLTGLSSTVSNNFTTLANADTTEANARLALASRVNTTESDIDALEGNVSSISATVSSNYSTLAAVDSAFAGTVSSIQTTLGGHTSTLSVYAASIDGIKAKYGVAFNGSGEATGFELLGGGGYTEATWVVNKLKVKGVGGSAFEPFVVDTDLNLVKMTNVQVDTLKAGSVTSTALADKSVTNHAFTIAAGSVFDCTNWQTITSAGLTTTGGRVCIRASFISAVVSGGGRFTVRYYRDGVSIGEFGFIETMNHNLGFPLLFFDQPSAGAHTYEVKLKRQAGDWDIVLSFAGMELIEYRDQK